MMVEKERFQGEKRRLWVGLMTAFQNLKSSYTEGGGTIFTRMHSERTKGKRDKFLHGKFCVDTRKTFFTIRIKEWDRLPREVVESPLLEMIQDLLGLTGPWIGSPNLKLCSQEKVRLDDLRRPPPN